MIDGIKRILYYISRNENTIKEVKNQVDKIQKINSLEDMLEDTDIVETVPEDKDMLLIQKDNTNKSDASEDTVESTANYTTEDTPEDIVSSTEADTTTSEKVCYRINLATVWLYIKTKLSNVLVGGEQTEVSTEDDGVNVFEFTDISGNKKSFKVKNGSKGPKGDTGPTTTVLSNQDYTVNSSSGHGFKVNNTAKPNSYAKLFADTESGALELGSNGGTYAYQMDCYADSFIRMYCFQRNPWKYMSHWTFDKDGNFSVIRFIENGTALSDKYQAKGSYAAASHTHDDRYYTKTELDSKDVLADGATVASGSTLAKAHSTEAEFKKAIKATRCYIGSTSGYEGWQDVISVRHRNGATDGTEYGMYIRTDLTKSDSLIWDKEMSNNNWQGERTILDSINYSAYAVPMSGGKMSGALTLPEVITNMVTITNGKTITIDSPEANREYGLRFTYFSNPWLQIMPTKDNVTALGHSLYRFAEFRCNNIYISSGTAVTSDRRYKENIANLEDKLMLNFVMALTPSSYKYKDGESGRTHYGLIAQDVEKVLENIGLSNKDFAGIVIEKLTKEVETKTVNDDGETVIEKHLEETGEVKYDLRYEEFIAPLIKVVQNQQNTINNLEERLLKLENQLSGNN